MKVQPMEIRDIEIRAAGGDEDMVQVRSLFEEYWASFGFTPCFQNFGQELLNLPGQYTPPGGDTKTLKWYISLDKDIGGYARVAEIEEERQSTAPVARLAGTRQGHNWLGTQHRRRVQ